MKSKIGFNHRNARTKEQKELMAKIEADGVCSFCAEHFKTYHPKPIFKETDFWFVTENMSPYEGTVHHFLFVYKPAHVSTLAEVALGAFEDLRECINWVNAKYAIKGGAYFMRFGDTRYNGSSVEHLHAQLVTGVIDDGDVDGIKVKLGFKKK